MTLSPSDAETRADTVADALREKKTPTATCPNIRQVVNSDLTAISLAYFPSYTCPHRSLY